MKDQWSSTPSNYFRNITKMCHSMKMTNKNIAKKTNHFNKGHCEVTKIQIDHPSTSSILQTNPFLDKQ